MTTAVLMKCGHAANATDSEGNPTCVICIGFGIGAEMVAQAPELKGRMAKCSYYPKGGKYGPCEAPRPSSLRLAFFQHNQNEETDTYFCGECWGWD